MARLHSNVKINYFTKAPPIRVRAAMLVLAVISVLLLVLSGPGLRPAFAQPLDPPTVDLDSASDTGASDTDDITSDNTPTFIGPAEADSTVEIFAGGTSLGTTTADPSGNWSFTPTSSLEDGEHSIMVTAGGSTSDTLVITIDTAAPSAPVITDPANNSYDNDGTFTISGTAKGGSTVELFEGPDSKGTATTDAEGNWSIDLTGVTEGSHTYTATATDAAGNTSSSSDSVAVTVDTIEPGAPEITSPADNTITNDNTPTFSGTAEAGSIVEVFDGSTSLGTTTADEESGNWSFTPSSTLSDDTHSVTATATDKAGNISSASTALSITIDTVPPAAPIIADPDNNSHDNNGAFTISGTAEPNSTVKLFDGADLKETIKADSSGYWSKVLTGVANGRHTYTARAVDAAGNESGPSNAVRVTVDTIAPEMTINSGPSGPTNRATATFAFSSSEPNSWFECRLDEGEFDYCTSPTTYNGLSEESHTFEVRAMDVAGNIDDTPASSTFTVDLTPPAQPTVDLDAASDKGSSDTDNITSENTPTFSGTAEADSTVTIYNGGVPLGEAVADSSGSYTFSPNTPLTDGTTYSITAKAKDAAGNTSAASTALSVTIDTQAPKTTIEKSGPSGTTNDNTPTFTFVSDEDGSTFECRLSKKETTPEDFESCTSPKTYPEQSEDAYTFEVRATDVAGNTEDPPANRTFTLDTQPPDAPVIINPANNSYDTDGDITFSGTAEAGSTVELFEGEQPKGTATADGSGSWSVDLTTVAEGPHTYTAKAKDAAGNESRASNAVKVTVDTIGPETTIDSGPSRVVNNRSATFEFSSSEAGATFECKLDGGTFEDCTSPQEYTNLEDGEHTFEVRATDVVGNKEGTPARHTWVVDTVTPSPVITSPDKKGYDKDGNFTISGTAEKGSTVELFEGTTFKDTAQTDNSGNWSADLTGVAKGKHIYTATATDTVTNTSEPSDPVVMIVDKTPPKVTRVGPADQTTGRSLDRNVTARFSERMNPDTLNARNVKLINTQSGSEVGGKVRCDDLCRTLRLDPNRTLKKNTKYKLIIPSRVTDLAGNRIAQNYVWTFTTGSR